MATTTNADHPQAAHWNGPAARAWVEGQTFMDRMLQPFEALLVAAVPSGFSGTVLDVGCGTGRTTVATAAKLGPGGRCVGVDISEPMLAAARTRAAEAGAAATFVCADAQDHGFAPGVVDLVLSRFGVMFFLDPVAAFANLRRATAAGGQLRAVAWRRAAENAFLTTAERAAAPFLPDLPPRRPDGPGQFAFGDGGRVRDILNESGWTDAAVTAIDVACALPEAELAPYIATMGPVGLALQSADAATRAQVIAAAHDAFAPYVRDGEVRFTAACWLLTARA